MDNIFNEIEESDINTKYLFFVIPIVCIFIFSKINVRLNLLLAIIISVILILYITHTNQKNRNEIEKIYNIKKDSLRPKSNIINKYDIIVDFLFSIQDMYAYNPPAFEYMTEHIEEFIELYEDGKIDTSIAGINYKLADRRRQLALNNLRSIIYMAPANKAIVDKIDESAMKLDDILEKMLYELYVINNKSLIKNGYDINSVIITTGPKPDNYYDKESHSFAIH